MIDNHARANITIGELAELRRICDLRGEEVAKWALESGTAKGRADVLERELAESKAQTNRFLTSRQAILDQLHAAERDIAELRACLELAAGYWIEHTSNRTWGADEAEARARIAKALGPETMRRLTAGFEYRGPLRHG